MIALDLKQNSPASTNGLAVDIPSQEGEGKLSFSLLLDAMQESEDGSSSLDKLLKELQSEIKGSDKKADSLVKLESLLKGDSSSLSLQSLKENLKNITKDTKLTNPSVVDEQVEQESPKGNDLVELLQGISSKDSKKPVADSVLSKDTIEINPELTKSVSSTELKMLISDAKEYLKNQILSSEGFKKSEIEHLPKTLTGLTQVAKKLGIDLSKITLQEVQPQKDVRPKEETKTSKSDLKSLSLFKAQKPLEVSTEQMVQVKTEHRSNLEVGKTKKRTDETLELLLQGKTASKKEGTNTTSDFSVQTAKVIAPSAKTEPAKSLEALLNPTENTTENTAESKSQSTTHAKTESFQVAKADSFEVKLNEAKQMVKYLSQDVKQAIDDYKSPFTRVKVQLNPQKLGEIELTVVQRGKNLHVNLSSNNSAINTLSIHANDLKVQLQNSGINNASLNFSNNSQGGEAAGGSQSNQQQQNRQQAQSEYNYFDQEETNEELLSSLEIVVPYYA